MACSSESCQLMVYSSSGVVGIESGSNSNRGSGIGSSDCYLESTDSILDSLSDLYSKLDIFLCKG